MPTCFKLENEGTVLNEATLHKQLLYIYKLSNFVEKLPNKTEKKNPSQRFKWEKKRTTPKPQATMYKDNNSINIDYLACLKSFG